MNRIVITCSEIFPDFFSRIFPPLTTYKCQLVCIWQSRGYFIPSLIVVIIPSKCHCHRCWHRYDAVKIRYEFVGHQNVTGGYPRFCPQATSTKKLFGGNEKNYNTWNAVILSSIVYTYILFIYRLIYTILYISILSSIIYIRMYVYISIYHILYVFKYIYICVHIICYLNLQLYEYVSWIH